MRITGVRGYLDYADEKISEEQKRAKFYLSTSSEADGSVGFYLVHNNLLPVN